MSSESQPSVPKAFGSHWVERKLIPTERAFFKFEMEFAIEMQRRLGLTLEEAMSICTWNLKNKLFNTDRDTKKTEPKAGVSFDNPEVLIELAHQNELTEAGNYPPTKYHKIHGPDYEQGGQFGCHYYTYPSRLHADSAIGIHFTNYEFADKSPLSDTQIDGRRQEVTDLLQNVATYHPDVVHVVGKSWLYNLPQYRQLFPESYLANLQPENDPRHWSMGSTIWGQFMDAQSALKTERAEAFLRRLKELPTGMSVTEMQSVLNTEGLLLLPQTTSGPIKDFYKMYDVQARLE